MTVCPNCKQRLHLWNISQNCPHCGVNMRFFGFEERFINDAKTAELSMARVHFTIRKLKASLIGGKLQIIRLILSLVPFFAFLIPFGEIGIRFPFLDEKISVSAKVLFELIGSMLDSGSTPGYFSCFPLLNELRDSSLCGDAVRSILTGSLFTAAAMATALIIFLLPYFLFINIRRMTAITCFFSAAGLLLSGAGAVFLIEGNQLAAENAQNGISVSIQYGWIAAIISFAAVLTVNFLLLKRGIQVDLDEGMAERVEIAKRVKRGEVLLCDLPQPIVETEETRKIREEIKKQKTEQKQEESIKEAELL